MTSPNSLLHASVLFAAPLLIELLFDPAHEILFLSFPAKMTRTNFERVDAVLAAYAARRGLVDTIIDFSGVSEDIDTQMIVAHAYVAPPMQGKRRLFIVSSDLIAGLLRMYSMHHAAAGFTPPKIVRSLDDALAALGAANVDFEPWCSARQPH
jgi:hypothetical protein